jgi:excisionase family DNA binding protein
VFENYDDILNVEEACEALKIGYNAMYELLNTGKLRGYRNGRVWRIPKAALVEYIREMAKMS